MQSAGFFPKIYGYEYNLLPTFIVALAIIANIHETVILTFLITFLCDLNYSMIEGLNTIYFVSASILISFVAEKYFQKSFVTNMLFVSATLLIQKIFQFLYHFIVVDSESFLLFFQISCAEILIATALCPVTYFIVYSINYVFKEAE